MTFPTVPSTPASPNSHNPLSTDVPTALIENRRVFLRVLARRMGSVEAAENILQQFHLRALSKASDIQKRESIRQWLFRVPNSFATIAYCGITQLPDESTALSCHQTSTARVVSVSIRPDSRVYEQEFNLTDRPRIVPHGWQS